MVPKIAVLLLLVSVAYACLNGACSPGNEYCGAPFKNAPMYHLMDQHGCGENDPNGPVFDPVHGVVHHFYQIHLAASPGHGPDYGHFVSKDFIHWAAMPVAIWNGLDSSVWPPKKTPYDNEAIFTGSAVVVDGAGPGGKGPGIVNIYPGLCNKNDWPACGTGTLLAQAIPADYATDPLLTNWTKPSYNPVIQNTQRDPSTPWKTPTGEWRLRTYNSMVYGSASDADMLAGKWYEIGTSKDFRTCECPSFYPLPPAAAGFEQAYAAAEDLPTHVHKTSCGGDWWQMGSYEAGPAKTLGSFVPTKGWEDLWAQKKIDQGHFYASKDNLYPTLANDTRRINWGWATVPPASTQTLPREVTFNPTARCLQQLPIDEIKQLRGQPDVSKTNIAVSANSHVDLGVKTGVTKQSELVVSFDLPSQASTFGIIVGDPTTPSGTPVGTMMAKTDMPGGDYSVTHHPAGTPASSCEAACAADAKCKAWTWVIRGSPSRSGDCCLKASVPCPVTSSSAAAHCTSGAKEATTLPSCGGGGAQTSCMVDFSPNTNTSAAFYEVPVSCGGTKDTLRLITGEKTVEIRLFADATFLEVFFQHGRVAMVVTAALNDDTKLALSASGSVNSAVSAASAQVFPMSQIWVTPDEVRAAPRLYN